jgi:hypothetical protein
MNLVKVEGFNNLHKDTSSGGVVNTDRASYESYKLTKALATRNVQQQRATQENVQHLQSEINTIKDDLADIRSLLVQLLQKGN